MVAESNPDFCLMDRKLIAVENGPKKIEACDIFTRDKKLIHVKNKGQSAQLSHLFSQGKVAAECFVSDLNFRKQVSDIVLSVWYIKLSFFVDTIKSIVACPVEINRPCGSFCLGQSLPI